MNAFRSYRLTMAALLLLLAQYGALVVPASAAENVPITAHEAILVSENGLEITERDLRRALMLLDQVQRRDLFSTPDGLRDLVARLYRDQRLLADAEAAGVSSSPRVQAQLEQARRDVILKAWRERYMAEVEPPDFEALAKEQYLAVPERYQAPERYRAAHILLRADPSVPCNDQRIDAGRLRDRIAAGADFAELARAHSEDEATADRGGELQGWVEADDLVPRFARALARLDDGAVSDIVETRYGYHIIKRLGYEPARVLSFDEVREDLIQELRASYRERAFERYWTEALPSPDAVNSAAIERLIE